MFPSTWLAKLVISFILLILWVCGVPICIDFTHKNTNGNGRLVLFVSDGSAEEAVLVYLHGLQGLHSLRALVPGLLRCEMEQAMVKLGLIYDKTYAWDIFSDMMVSSCNPCQVCTVATLNLLYIAIG